MIEEHDKKHSFMKYLGLFCATLLGAFLAVYFVTDIAVNRLMDPFVAMKKMDREFRRMDRDMDDFVKEVPPHKIKAHFGEKNAKGNAVDFFRTPKEYKFVVDLKPFNNNPDNIKVIAEETTLTITGEATEEKKNTETFTSFSHTYTLDNANFEEMSQKKVLDKLIITIPLKG